MRRPFANPDQVGEARRDFDETEDWPLKNPTKPDKALHMYMRRWKVRANGTPKSDAATVADLCSRASANCCVEDILRPAALACMFVV